MRIDRSAFWRMGGAVAIQALLSAGSLLVGAILIRHTASAQYGYFVLVTNAILLLTILQSSFIQPQLVPRLARADKLERADLIGGVLRGQRRLWLLPAAACALAAVLLRLLGRIDWAMASLLLAAGVALWAALYREFFRMVLLGQRRPHDVLVGDLAFIAVSIGGAWLATLTSSPATVAVCTYAVGATFGATLCALTLRRLDPWNIRGAPGILRAIVPMGLWSTAGAAIHWLFSQGYNYVVAATLDASAVAEIAATRLLIMPVNMLSTGIGSMMLPTVSAWLDQHSREHILRRVCLFALLLACVAICYFAAVWYFRGWLFGSVLRKHFANQDPLLLLWFMVGVLMLFRDQLVYLLIARSRLRALTALTLASAVVGLAVSYMAMSHFGTPGALVGVLCGEIVNVAGIGVLSWREVHFHEA